MAKEITLFTKKIETKDQLEKLVAENLPLLGREVHKKVATIVTLPKQCVRTSFGKGLSFECSFDENGSWVDCNLNTPKFKAGIQLKGNFVDCMLTNGQLKEVDMKAADFVGCVFTSCGFEKAQLPETGFVNCELYDAKLVPDMAIKVSDRTRFNWANWEKVTILNEASVAAQESNMSTLKDCTIKGNFVQSIWKRTIFDGCTFEGDFRGADFKLAKFKGINKFNSCKLDNASFEDASIAKDAKIEGRDCTLDGVNTDQFPWIRAVAKK